MANYRYCVATITGKGFIKGIDSRKLSILSFPGNVWRLPQNNTYSDKWVERVGATNKTLSEAQEIVNLEISTFQTNWDNIPNDDPRKIENNILYKKRPSAITLEE
mgnify:CR=1|jgi:hypothetical protein|tara:strand:+ start:20 stop:334 length:315 start_codon:yes stop_codon:yes gene_type:complete